ncbi:3465_t:CDS:2, partial [Diversispora eburnea]
NYDYNSNTSNSETELSDDALCEYMAGSRRARRNRIGAQYFDEFRTHFWERPEDEFDRIRNINTSNRRRNRDMGDITPAPSIEEVERELSMRSTVRRINRSSSITTNNPDAEQNIGVRLPPAETSSLQSPPYEATNETQNQSHDDSNNLSSNLGNFVSRIASNMLLSRNESDVSMHDVGGSQPL